jgi:hypothetical protein
MVFNWLNKSVEDANSILDYLESPVYDKNDRKASEIVNKINIKLDEIKLLIDELTNIIK